MTTALAHNLLLYGSTGTAISLLALAMQRHHEVVFGRPITHFRKELLRLSGWFVFAAGLLIALSRWDGGISLVAWFAFLSAQAFVVAILVAYARRITLWYVVVSITTMIATAGFSLLFPQGFT